MKLIINQGSRYEASSNAAGGAADANVTHQLSTAMARPEEDNEDDVQQDLTADDDDIDDDDTVAVSDLSLASMKNILGEMEERRTNRSNSRRLPYRWRLDSQDRPTSAQLPEALIGAEARRSTTLLRRIVSNDEVEHHDDRNVVAIHSTDRTMPFLKDGTMSNLNDNINSKVVAATLKDRSMSTLIDIVDEAMQVGVREYHYYNDQPHDFRCMPEETTIVVLELNSTKSTIKKYSCNKDGDFFDKLDRKKAR
jgi:hypothetical protein